MITIENIGVAYVFGRAGAEYYQAQVTLSRGGRVGFCRCSSSYSWCPLIGCPSLGFRTLQTGEKGLRPLVSQTPGPESMTQD